MRPKIRAAFHKSDACADHVSVGGGLSSLDDRRRRAEPILAASAAAWPFRPAAAFGGVSQQRAPFCTRNCALSHCTSLLLERDPLWTCYCYNKFSVGLNTPSGLEGGLIRRDWRMRAFVVLGFVFPTKTRDWLGGTSLK